MESKRKKRAKLIILLSIIWFVVALPLPWLYLTPEEATPQMVILLKLIGIISIPFIVLGVAWSIKPELTT
ncbi:MAG TPA: hypothetical protein VFM64_05160 [Candidatus Nitrosotenuis sp.]|nr:hypothetical protein [Candidatus Nitrosotenuis sp.]